MYFINEEHKKNYKKLMEIYKLQPQQNVQYESNLYIAAVPAIYKLIDENEFKPGQGPLIPLTIYDEEEGRLLLNHAGLTGGTSWLVQAGLSLYNGNSCDLDYTNSVDFTFVFIEAVKIRNKVVNVTTI